MSRRARDHAAAAPASPAPTITTGSESATRRRLSSNAVTHDGIRGFIDEHEPARRAALDEWLRTPGISAQPARHDAVRRSGGWFARAARRAGFPTVEIWD